MTAIPTDTLRLKEFEEAVGVLLRITEFDGFAVAIFAWGAVSLPVDMAGKLRELVGRRVGILHLGGYRVRDLSEAHAFHR